MSIDPALTKRLIKSGEYKKIRWNRPDQTVLRRGENGACPSRPIVKGNVKRKKK